MNPGASLIKNRYCYFLNWMGDFKKAIPLAMDALASDPSDNNSYINLGNSYLYSGNYNEAERYMKRGRNLFPQNKGLQKLEVAIDFYKKDYTAVINKIKTNGSPDTAEAHDISYYGISQLKLGNKKEFDRMLAVLKELAQGN